jgi:hypothetical protein
LNTTAEQNASDLYDEILKTAAAHAQHYLQTIRERHVGVSKGALKRLTALGGPLPSHGEDPQFIL